MRNSGQGLLANPTQPRYKISRDWDILELSEGKGMSVKEIKQLLGLTESTIYHALADYKEIEKRGDKYTYIDLGLDLADRLDNAGCGDDVDRCVTLIMHSLWVYGYNTRAKIAKMTVEQIDELVHGHRIHRAGSIATAVFLDWQNEIKREAKEKAKKKKAATK